VIQITLIRVKVCLSKLTQALRHGIAAEPDPGRQLQEKAGGVTPAGLFSSWLLPDVILFKKALSSSSSSPRG
jgi:hypothetical protein